MLKIFSSIPMDMNASFYYRITLPLEQMEKQGFESLSIVDDHKGTSRRPPLTPEERLEAFALADINLVYQTISPAYSHNISTLRDRPPHYVSAKHVWYPPCFIADTDDDLFNCMPLNPAFKRLGIRAPDGSMLEDGSEIKIKHPQEDKEIVLWKDGEKGFDLDKNRARAESWRRVLQRVNLVTTTTQRARDYVLREVPSADVFISPNAIDFEEYHKVELADHPGEVRIMWQGSHTHHEDLWPILNSIKRITEKYPQVTWVFFGSPYPWLYRNLPAERVTAIKWVDYCAYKTRLSTINHDINICPLTPHPFNQSRSAIKFYESSAIWKPAATLAQRAGEYQDVIIEGETGMLFDNPKQFEEKLSTLVEDSLLRVKMAANAKDWIKTHRDVGVIIPKLYEKYVEVREKYVKGLPEPLPWKEPHAKSVKQRSRTRKQPDIAGGSRKSGAGDRSGERSQGVAVG